MPDSGCPRGRRERYATAKSLLLGLVGRAAKKRTGIGDLVGEGRGGGRGGEFKEWEEFEARQVFSPYALCATPETLVESRRCFFHSFKSLMMPHKQQCLSGNGSYHVNILNCLNLFFHDSDFQRESSLRNCQTHQRHRGADIEAKRAQCCTTNLVCARTAPREISMSSSRSSSTSTIQSTRSYKTPLKTFAFP